VDGFSMTPSFSRDTTEYQITVDSSVTNVNIIASVIDSKATVSGSGNVQITDTSNDITIRVTAENGSIRDYHIRVTRQSGGATYNGMVSSGTNTTVSPTSGTSSGTASSGSGTTTSAVVGPGIGISPGGSSSSSSSSSTGGSQATPGGSTVTIIN
jgi:hypothetical protein